GADSPQLFQTVGVEHHNLVLLGVHDVEQAALRINRQTHRVGQPFGNLVDDLMLGTENQDAVRLGVGDEEAIIVVNRQPVDPTKVGFVAIADELNVTRLRVENEDCAYFLVGHINQPLGVNGNSV